MTINENSWKHNLDFMLEKYFKDEKDNLPKTMNGMENINNICFL